MHWYAESPALRARQVVHDLLVLLWVVVWLRVGTAVHDAVGALAAPGRQLVRAGDGLTEGLSRAAERADDLPLVGDELSGPLDAAAGAGQALSDAGAAQQDAVGVVSLVLALVVAGLPIALVLLREVPRRVAFAREHGAARRLRDDVELWALRAALHRPLHELAALGPDPVGRWRRGEPGAAEALARLEQRAAGLRA
jgi:hypothetical protein